MTGAVALSLAAALVSQVTPLPSAPEPGAEAVATREVQVSLIAPPRPQNLTRVELKLRPFLGLVGNSWGGIGEARLEHYFRLPFMLGLELAPLATGANGEGPGAIAQVRVHGAFVTDYIAIGLGVGAQMQRFGRNGLSIAPTLRLGSLDGLNLRIEYAYSVAANRYTGQRTVGFSNILGTLDIPLTRRLALELDAGLNLKAWAYATIGLRHRLRGDGGPGSLYLTGALGAAWLADRSACDYDAAVPCGASARSFGPTVSAGIEYRF